MAASIKAQYNTRPEKILGSKMCQEALFEDEFDLIEAKYRGVNKHVNVRI